MILCVESVDYYVLVNSETVGPVIPGCGLRHGGPLSTYLFITCAEVLSSLIRDAKKKNSIPSTRVCRGAPPKDNAPLHHHSKFTF